MLVELSVVEQRYQAVLEVLGGATVVDVARRYGVARQTVHGWLRRYASQGLAGLVDRSSKPDTCPHQTPAGVEARIVEMRKTHPGWGPRTIEYHLARSGLNPVPSRSSIFRCLIRHGLIDPPRPSRESAFLLVSIIMCFPASRGEILSEIEGTGMVAVIRARSADELLHVCESLVAGGVTACEVTMTTPDALDVIEDVSKRLGGDCLVGVGSVLDAETCRAAILAGASFVVAPTFDLDVIKMAHRYDRPVIPGALTPTEIQLAWSNGADIVKVFPANHFGPGYFRDLRGPMPQLRLTPTGGVNLDTVQDWIDAGAVCVGVGSALVKHDFIDGKDWNGLTSLAKRYIELVAEARHGR